MQGPVWMFAPLSILQQQFTANTLWIHVLCCQNFKLRRQQNADNLNILLIVSIFKEKKVVWKGTFWQELSPVYLENWGKMLWLKDRPTCRSIAQLGGLELRLLAATLPNVNNGTSKAFITPNPLEMLKKNPDAEHFHCSWWIISYIWWEGLKLFFYLICVCVYWGKTVPLPGSQIWTVIGATWL